MITVWSSVAEMTRDEQKCRDVILRQLQMVHPGTTLDVVFAFHCGGCEIDVFAIGAMGVVIGDFKECDVLLKGTMNGPWAFVDGDHVTAYGRKENPYMQLKRYRSVLPKQIRKYEHAYSDTPVMLKDNASRITSAGMVQSPELNAVLEGFDDPWWYACGVSEWAELVLKRTNPTRGSTEKNISTDQLRAWLEHLGFESHTLEEAVEIYCDRIPSELPPTSPEPSTEAIADAVPQEIMKPASTQSTKRTARANESEVEQQAAIHSSSDSHLIVRAGPGSGKTHVLTQRARQIFSQTAEDESVVIITYTNDARDELKRRIKGTPGKGYRYVGTVHQFALKCANDAAEKPYRVLADAQEIDVITTLADVGYVEARELRRKIMRGSHETDELSNRLYEYLGKHGYVTFQTMLERGIDAVREMPDTAVPTYVMIDEFQDVTKPQMELLLALRDRGSVITAVGDPEQAIFGFAGGDPKYLMNFVEYFPGALQLDLRVNRRSGIDIVSLADSIRQDDLSLLASCEHAGDIRTYEGRNSKELAEHIARWMKEEIAEVAQRQRCFRDIAVLCRTRTSSDAMRRALVKEEIPYQEEFEISEIRLIRLFHQALLMTDVVSDVGVLQLVNANLPGVSKNKWEECFDAHFKGCVEAEDIMRSLQDLPKEGSRLWEIEVNRLVDVYRAITNVARDSLEQRVEHIWLHVMKPYQQLLDDRTLGFVAKYVFAAHCKAKFGLYKTANQLVQDLQDLNGINLNPDVNSVHFTTIHKAKGREWPIVILLDVCQGVMPHWRSEEIDVEEGVDEDLVLAENLAEEQRLLHVAVSRAKEQLVISMPQKAGRGQGESVFAKYLPDPEMIAE